MAAASAERQQPQGSRSPVLVQWALLVGLGMLTACLVVVFHELGHYIPQKLFGLPGVQFHYASATFAGEENATRLVFANRHAEVAFPLAQLAWSAAGGPLMSVLITAVAAYLLARRHGPIWFVAGVQSSCVRVLMGLIQLGAHWNGSPVSGSDETILAATLRIPMPAVVGTEVLLVMALFIWMALGLPRGRRLYAWTALLVSTAFGWFLWFNLVGPRLLP